MIDLKIDLSQAGKLEIPADKIFTPRFMKEMGNAFVYHIRAEARKDLQQQGNKPTPRGKPEGIPDDPKFFDSFGFDIKGHTIEIYSTWPWIKQIMEGRSPYPMRWAMKASSKNIPLNKKTPIIRAAPDSRNPWIHPGFKSHDFIERGMKIAYSKLETNIANQVRKVWEGRG